MTKYLIAAAAVSAFALSGISATEAKAQGFHFRAGGVHIDVGNPHYGYGHGYYRHEVRRSHGHGHRVWHDTSHYDYHPPEVIRHRNHYHVVPGHYDFHREGHWDRHRSHHRHGRHRH